MAVFEIIAIKTYATRENAIKAVEKSGFNDCRFFIMKDDKTSRYFPVFVGQEAVHAGAHFHFNIVG
jgi:hypothetical protein